MSVLAASYYRLGRLRRTVGEVLNPAEIFVSPQGTPGGIGTRSMPLDSYPAAVAAVQSGGVVRILDTTQANPWQVYPGSQAKSYTLRSGTDGEKAYVTGCATVTPTWTSLGDGRWTTTDIPGTPRRITFIDLTDNHIGTAPHPEWLNPNTSNAADVAANTWHMASGTLTVRLLDDQAPSGRVLYDLGNENELRYWLSTSGVTLSVYDLNLVGARGGLSASEGQIYAQDCTLSYSANLNVSGAAANGPRFDPAVYAGYIETLRVELIRGLGDGGSINADGYMRLVDTLVKGYSDEGVSSHNRSLLEMVGGVLEFSGTNGSACVHDSETVCDGVTVRYNGFSPIATLGQAITAALWWAGSSGTWPNGPTGAYQNCLIELNYCPATNINPSSTALDGGGNTVQNNDQPLP
ncbi:MAG: hypothetical protein AAGN64_02205 [Bacteroidota bacterium]